MVNIIEISKETVSYQETTYANIFSDLPERDINALSGSEFVQSIIYISPDIQRDNLFYDEIVKANIPNFMRNMMPITINEKGNSLIIWVSPDFVSIGNDEDYFRLPMNGKLAGRICKLLNCLPPTKKISDLIWKNADLKLTPKTMPPDKYMITTKVAADHNNIIKKQINGMNFGIIDGIKKDVIIDKALINSPHTISIFGWKYLNGQSIQGPLPNSTFHSISYSDYSQGLRLVSSKCSLNKESYNLYDVLNDPKYAYLISEQGSYNARNIYI